jgi:hypothetical protein
VYFPLSYSNDIILYKPKNFSTSLFVDKIKDKVSIVYTDDNKIVFNAPLSYSKLPVKITVFINDDETDTLFVKYNISLFENNVIFVLAITFATFFYYFDVTKISILFIIGGIIFYLLNIAKISKSIKDIVNKLFDGNSEIGEPALWKKQQIWINDQTVCPACGEKINSYSAKCLNCGLFLTKKPINSYTNTNTTSNIFYKVIFKKSQKK